MVSSSTQFEPKTPIYYKQVIPYFQLELLMRYMLNITGKASCFLQIDIVDEAKCLRAVEEIDLAD